MTDNKAKFVSYIQQNEKDLVDSLAAAVAIPSVSGDAAYRQHVFEMADWLQQQFEDVGGKVTKKPLGKQTLDGKEIELPPAVLVDVGNDSSKKTVLIYGHFDVQPALKSDGWNTEPFTLVHDKESGRLYGRGSTDDKGPILGWLHVLKAHKALGLELPVNLKFCLEGMEESGSVGLEELVESEKDSFLSGVDAVCISDNYWLGTEKPCVTNGLRGIAYFKVAIEGPGRDLHSGVFGGMVHEPMTDLVNIMARLVTPDGKILIPGINEQVAPLTDDERKVYDVMHFQMSDIHSAAGSETTISDEKRDVLMARMRYPSLSLHGIEGAFSEPGSKTVIPARVVGKFSIRLVPNMDGQEVVRCVSKYVEDEFKKCTSTLTEGPLTFAGHSKNKLHFSADPPGMPWMADPHVRPATGPAQLTCSTGTTRRPSRPPRRCTASSPTSRARVALSPSPLRLPTRYVNSQVSIILTFQLNKNVLLLPMGRSDDGAHSTNEKVRSQSAARRR